MSRRDDVQEYPIDGEALLYDPRHKTLYHLNETAHFVWRQCNGHSLADISRSLNATYDVDAAMVTTQITRILELFAAGELFVEGFSNGA